MRICFVSRRYWPAVSGMSVYAENLLRELVALGHDVTLVSQYRDDEAGTRVYGGGPPPPERVPAGVRVVALASHGETVAPADFEGDLAELVATVERLHAERPFDILHAQYGYPPGLAVQQASRSTGVPTAVSIQGGDGHWVGTCCTTHAEAMRTVVDSSSAVLIGSASFRDEVVGNLGSGPARFTIVPGATDTRRFTPAERPLGVLREPPVLLFHGRVDRRKGVLDLLEAMASGLPTVSTDSVGVVDCLRHEENGLLHAPGDVAGLRAALTRLLADGALRTRLATTALEEVRRLYSWPVLAASIDAVYREVAGTTPSADWSMPSGVDLSCRFRSAAHLL